MWCSIARRRGHGYTESRTPLRGLAGAIVPNLDVRFQIKPDPVINTAETDGVKRLLIEEGLPFETINEASHREKSGNSPDHPRRLHLWWARRPLAMSRAIVLGSASS